ncbi:MAG TPA: hypothetical protein VH414_16080 [Lichenihabitans sp.]|jgi:hypothetical protein|nr:hypothetical protein [Lichenihabitans sp.]
MMSPLADFLPIFGHGQAGALAAGGAYDADLDGLGEGGSARFAADDAEQRIADARTEVQAEAVAAIEAALAEQAAALEARHALSLAEERRGWAAEQGVVLVEALSAGLDRLEASLAESLVHVLEPFFEAATRARATADLRQALADLMAQGHGASVKVRGPADLVDPLRSAFEGRAGLAFEEAAVAEVTVECDDTTIRSQLQSWADTLHAYLYEVDR